MRNDLNITILSTGVVAPENRLEIKPPIAGRIERVLIQEGQKVSKGQILAWMSSTERAALLDAARSKGAEELKKWEDLYRPTPIMAPLSGTIILRNVEPGQTFTSNDSVFSMSDRLTVKAQVDETDISQIVLKQEATIVLDAYPGETIDAAVDQIAFDAKTVNNVTTYSVDVLPEETPPSFRSGMTANVTFKVNSKEKVLTVPNDALKVTEKDHETKYSILVKDPQSGKPLEREIEVGLSDGKKTEITKGLTENEIVLAAEIKFGDKSNKAYNPFAPQAPARGQRGGGGH